jgi:hypothetical protein
MDELWFTSMYYKMITDEFYYIKLFLNRNLKIKE